MTGSRGQAVAAWTLHYEANTNAAVKRIAEMREHGIPEGRHGEWLGACLALTPPEHRCAHWGDDRNCTQCLTEQLDAESEARPEHRRVRRRRR